MEVRKILEFRFLGEQDGEIERELKDKLIEIFRQYPTVLKAYLSQAIYDKEENSSVVLCLKTTVLDDKKLVKDISEIFSSIFGRDQYLDTVFINESQEKQLIEICSPFYSSNS